MAAQQCPDTGIFVLWHPRCHSGKAWRDEFLNGCGRERSGAEVFYRCLPAPGRVGQPATALPGEMRLAADVYRPRGEVSNLQSSCR